ncbi:AraC family transcriptional regulator [Streptomyces sp. NPDC048309]|uniref:AraC family transcriptional regulator n=1 Tax=Streptomyces sp. NPDC048309 TaxID=3154618 RepID=UPI0033DB9552
MAGGTLRHSVDFTDCAVAPGGWLWVRPGQIHRYIPDDLARARGTIVIWQPGFVLADPPFDQSPLLPPGPHARAAGLALRHLAHEYADLGSLPLDAHIQALRLLLSVPLLRLAHARPDPVSSAPADDTFRRYSAALERDFRTSHRVADYAAALGYSARTLTRATLAATGSTAKQYLDARVLLEAKRPSRPHRRHGGGGLPHARLPRAERLREVLPHPRRAYPLEFRALARGQGRPTAGPRLSRAASPAPPCGG